MSLLLAFRRTPQKPPGRHSAAWAAVVEERAALRLSVTTLTAANEGLQKEREQRQQQHALDIEGWEQAWDHVSTKHAETLAERDQLLVDKARLQALLDALGVDPDGERGISVPAPKDTANYGVDASRTARTCQDATLASLVESDEDRELLSALGHSIPAPTDAADTLLLDLSRLHGPSETAVMPAVPTLDLDAAGHNRGPHPAYRKVPCSSPMTGPQRMLPAVVEPDALPPVTWGTEQQPVVPQLKAPLPDEADTVRLPVVEAVVPLWHNLTPVSLRAGDNANRNVTAAVEDQLTDQLANAT